MARNLLENMVLKNENNDINVTYVESILAVKYNRFIHSLEGSFIVEQIYFQLSKKYNCSIKTIQGKSDGFKGV